MAKVFGNAGEVILNGLKGYVQEVSEQELPPAGELVRHDR